MSRYDIQELKAAAFDALVSIKVSEGEMIALLCGMDLLIQQAEARSGEAD